MMAPERPGPIEGERPREIESEGPIAAELDGKRAGGSGKEGRQSPLSEVLVGRGPEVKSWRSPGEVLAKFGRSLGEVRQSCGRQES